MGFGWEGKNVRLVPLDYDRHFENSYRWINDPSVSEWLAVGDHPMTRLAEKEWFDACQKVSDTAVHFAIETLEGRHIGNTGLFQLSLRHGITMTGSLIGDVGDRGKGLGTDAAIVRAHYAFHVLGLRMMYSEYFVGNTGSERMQAKTGYVEYGRKPKAFWKRGAYRDMVLTVLTRERFYELHTDLIK